MSQPVVVTIPHSLGRDEVMRRLRSGLARTQGNFAGLSLTDQSWTDDQFMFRAAAFGQTANGKIDVAEDHLRIEVQLPWFLAPFAKKLETSLQRQGQLLLGKP